MLKPSDSINNNNQIGNFEELLQQEQKQINETRVQLIESLKNLKPPDSTKSAIFKWNDSVINLTKQLEEANTNYVNKLHLNYEESNQKIINKMENTLV
jgi:hypothetical protein